MPKTGEAKTGESRTGDTATRDPSWLLDGERLETVTAETRTHRDLRHVYRVDQSTLDDQLKPLQATATKLDTDLDSDGSFVTTDHAATDGTHELRPPADRRPPRTVLTALVAEYDQRAIDQAIDRYEVTATWRVDANREPDGTATDESKGADKWLIDLRSAAIATKKVGVDIREGTPENVEAVNLTLTLDPTQTKVLEESLTRLGAVHVDEVRDTGNRVSDDSESPAFANTLTVATPNTTVSGKTGETKTGESPTGGGLLTSGSPPVENGRYVCRDWSTEWLTAQGLRVTLALLKA